MLASLASSFVFCLITFDVGDSLDNILQIYRFDFLPIFALFNLTDYTFDKITCTKFNFPIDKFSKDQLSKDHLSTDQIYRRSVVIGSNVQKISCHRFKCPKDQLSRRSNVKRSVVYSSNVQ